MKIWQASVTHLELDSIPLLTSVPYSDAVATVVLQAKENSNRIAQKLMATVISKAIQESFAYSSAKSLLITPIPSSKSALRRRGEDFLKTIVRQSLDFYEADIKRNKSAHLITYPTVELVELIEHRRRVKEQSGLQSHQRQINMEGAFMVSHRRRARWAQSVAGEVILVDDVITTGSTLIAAKKALNEAGFTVISAVTACATVRRMPIR